MFFVLLLAWDKDMSHACDKTKTSFFFFFTKLKTYHLSYSIYVGFTVEKKCIFCIKVLYLLLTKNSWICPCFW